MRECHTEIEIEIPELGPDIKLCIYGNRKDRIFSISEEEALENGEAPHQLLEGNFYHYYFKSGNKQTHEYQLCENIIVKNSLRKNISEGSITPNIYVGLLELDAYALNEPLKKVNIYLEVLASKMDSESLDKSYRENYRYMIKDITDRCTELLLQINSPTYQNFEIDFKADNRTIYQRFAFVQSLILSSEFTEAIQRIISSPLSKWKEESEFKDIRSVRRVTGATVRQIVSGSNRIPLSTPIGNLKDVPSKIDSVRKVETLDTHENRFVKHALEVFLQFCSDCKDIFSKNNYRKSEKEATYLTEILEGDLNHPFFSEIERPVTLKLNSPALQKKGGYREILNAWLQFDLAAKLIWKGGDDVYRAGKRDIATLYEYWLFFVLYDLVKEKFKLENHSHESEGKIKSYDHLIEETKDGLNVMLQSGKFTALEGVYFTESIPLYIQFSFNRTFSGDIKYNEKSAGSWTKALRPDYTLSVWPAEYSAKVAEEKEKIVHIHFDSKYKIDQFKVDAVIGVVKDEDDPEKIIDSLEKEKKEERKGVYKNADLMKMHAYKDAIRRTSGAYVLYPGLDNHQEFKGFHEIIPGLGAFAVRPKQNETGVQELSHFIDKVIAHFTNMATQRRHLASKVFEIHKSRNEDVVNETIPENLIPSETFIIVGYCKNSELMKWYAKTGIYNFRMNDDKGSLILKPEVVNAKYLLLRDKGKETASRFFRIKSQGPRVYSKVQMNKLSYPSEKIKDFYLVIEIEESNDFNGASFEFKKLKKFDEIKANRYTKVGVPFAVSLTELINTIVK